MKRFLTLFLAFIMVLSLCSGVSALGEKQEVTILFTHDLHSHLLPAEDTDGGEYGGYARLMTAIRQQKEIDPNAILVDGGDFAMGSLFQTAYATSALELRIMGAMGYDATTFGNHEFDYLPKGLAGMLNAAVASGERVPAIVEANYLPPKEGEEGYGEDAKMVWDAFENYGVKEYILLERGGVYYAIFGIFGFDADDCAPNSGMVMEDPATAAQRVVDAATAECKNLYGVEPIVVALSHSGTDGGEGEDYELAQAVNGIDVIISGHTHTKLKEAIEVNGTYICSAAEYGKNLGVLKLEYSADGSVNLVNYELIPIDETVEEDPQIAALVENYKTKVEEDYLSDYGMTFDQVLVNNQYIFETVSQVKKTLHEPTVCNVFSDAYKWMAERITGETVDVALTAAGVIRETIPLGDVTVSDIFNAASLGVGTEGELVSVYLTGADLKCALEVDASLSPLIRSVQLYMAGIEYSINNNRMIFNKVDYAALRRNDGTLEQIQDDKLYHVICGTYMAQMLGTVESSSFGLLTITPRDQDGNPIPTDEIFDHVVRDDKGVAVKEWYAISVYLQNMGGEMDEHYAQVDGRKVVYASWNPVDLVRNANHFTWIVLGLILVVILLVALLIRTIVRRIKKKKK